MASRIMYDTQSLTREVKLIVGSFAPNGASAISAASNSGKGWSVARTGTGEYTITFDDVYASLVSATATMQLASLADDVIQVGTYTAASRTLVLTAHTGGVAGDIAADANNRVNFCVAFTISGSAA